MSQVKERILFIDALRGYAILMMLQGHTIGVVLKEELQDNRYPAHLVWWYLKGLTAPAFFAAAGLIFAYLMARAEEAGGSRLVKGVKRGLWLLVLGWLLQIFPATWKKVFEGDWAGALHFLTWSHVLHTIGLSLLVMVGLWLLCRRKGTVFAVVALVLGQLSFITGSVLERWEPVGLWQRIPGTFLAKEFAMFPLQSWLGYVLTGGALGVLAWYTKWYRQRWCFGALMVAGLAMMFGNWILPTVFWGVFGGLDEELMNLVTGRYWRSGEVLLLAGMVGLVFDWIGKRGWGDTLPVRVLTTCGQETLTIYFLHIFVVYGAWFGLGLTNFFKREFGVFGSVVTALLVEVVFIGLAMNLRKLRKAWPWLSFLR